MAKRRMFDIELMESDAFLDLPEQAQLLYVHLCMYADDEGFISGAKKVTRMLGMPEDRLAALENGGFLLRFASGVCVIRHWKISNRIRTDRVTPTLHREEKAQLVFLEGDGYRFSDDPAVAPFCQPNGAAGKEREEQVSSVQSADAAAEAGEVVSLPTSRGADYRVTRELAARLSGQFPAVNVPEQLLRMQSWCEANPDRIRAYDGTHAFIVSWLSREADKKKETRQKSVASYDLEAAELRMRTAVPVYQKRDRQKRA